jgi:hypothetical protein
MSGGEFSHGPRIGWILRGDGMLTVTKPLAYGSEVLVPGRSRFSIDHPAVRQRPELFTAANPRDTDTLRKLDCALTRRRAKLRRNTESGGSRQAHHLPARSEAQSRWRL